jgi:hypothetical protein
MRCHCPKSSHLHPERITGPRQGRAPEEPSSSSTIRKHPGGGNQALAARLLTGIRSVVTVSILFVTARIGAAEDPLGGRQEAGAVSNGYEGHCVLFAIGRSRTCRATSVFAN